LFVVLVFDGLARVRSDPFPSWRSETFERDIFLGGAEVAKRLEAVSKTNSVIGFEKGAFAVLDTICLRRIEALEFPLAVWTSSVRTLQTMRQDFRLVFVRLLNTALWQLTREKVSGAYLRRVELVYVGLLHTWKQNPRRTGFQFYRVVGVMAGLCGYLRTRWFMQNGRRLRDAGRAIMRSYRPQWSCVFSRPARIATPSEAQVVFDFLVFQFSQLNSRVEFGGPPTGGVYQLTHLKNRYIGKFVHERKTSAHPGALCRLLDHEKTVMRLVTGEQLKKR